jgi:DtxR family Mn-dependent transcriptional regulator
MATSTVENYIKQILLEQQRNGDERVSPGRLAAELGVVPGTVTTMLKALAEAGLADYELRRGVKLTPAGQKLAMHVLRRHRLIELFLVRVLGFDSSEVHTEAEELEHAVSDKLMERIDEFLDHPAFDPHGDPIPSAGGKLSHPTLRPLTACDKDSRVRIARILDQDSRFLRYTNSNGLVPGAELTIQRRDIDGDSITVKIDGKPAISLGSAAGEKIMVDRCTSA